MLISEAMVQLQPYGVERINRISNNTCQVWNVRQRGEDYIFAASLETVVRALTVANDWEDS